jgi:hypothetical protein
MFITALAFLASTFQPMGDAPVASTATPSVRPEGAPAPGSAKRLVGDADIKPVLENGEYRLPQMEMLIEAPLPEGYPAPTPPGMIELKTYPTVRRAEYRAKGASDFGMNVGFWPLFNHIKGREIAMTSPVEMDYHPAGERTPLAPMAKAGEGSWIMSFLYRTNNLGPTGADGRVQVVDNPEVTVVSIGMRGQYGVGAVNTGLDQLQKWFDGQDEWEPFGDPRGLNYNGPDVPMRNKWSEVQVQVRRKAKAGDATKTDAQTNAPAAPATATKPNPSAVPTAPTTPASPAPAASPAPVTPPAA